MKNIGSIVRVEFVNIDNATADQSDLGALVV